MKFKTLLTASLTAALLSGTAMAQSSPVTRGIADQLAASGYTQISITRHGSRFEVVASGPNGTITRTYGRDGSLISTTDGPDATGTTATGTTATGTRHGDDRNGGDDNGRDDNGRDDHGGGMDGDHGGNGGHDGGEGGHDGGHDGGEGDHDGGEGGEGGDRD